MARGQACGLAANSFVGAIMHQYLCASWEVITPVLIFAIIVSRANNHQHRYLGRARVWDISVLISILGWLSFTEMKFDPFLKTTLEIMDV